MARPDFTDFGNMVAPVSAGYQTALNLAAAQALYQGYAVLQPIALNRISFIVTTAVTTGSIAGQVGFVRYPTYGSTTNSVAIGTLTIPTAASVGQVYYKDVSYVKLNAGEELAVWIARQGTDGGTAAGAGFVGFSFELAPDADGNQTNEVKSA